MTPNPINAFKTIIYNTKHTNNTQIHFPENKMLKTNRKLIFPPKQKKMISVLC